MWKPEFFFQTIVSAAACGGGFIFGILLGWSSPTALKIVEQDDYEFFITSDNFSWIVASMALGATFSCILSGIIRSKIGTRYTILLFGIPIIAGWVLITLPQNIWMLIIGRVLCGVAAGCYCFVVPIYIGEISSIEVRGSMLSLFQVAINSGVLFVYTLGKFTSFTLLNIICGSITILYSLGFLALPESPNYLIEKNQDFEAEKSIERLRGGSISTKSLVESLREQSEASKAQRKTFVEVFQTKQTKKAFIIVLVQMFFFQMSGINVILLYLSTIFNDAGIEMDSGIASIIVSLCKVASNMLAVFLVDRFGRKIMLSFSNGLMSLGLAGIGVFFILKDFDVNVSIIGWLPVTFLCIFVIAFSFGMGPISYVLQGELFQQEAKAFVAPIGQVVNFALTFAASLTFPMITNAIGSGATFFILSAFCALALVFTIFVIPETKGKSHVQIQKLLGAE